ncbi:IS1634 family transposase [Phormidium sp. LEGE 05292]|uniref:IS1634 family transposase n=1 Tax=[Phormidium] sp. LEGE 05292 TaxID=767427 RepID=UPI001882B729|nr:IS1634 family transposase [Phormidium sp. LEGE 05292]MBE9226344.1 IS1634 family transposase [Phormidium sp. LEGE 05292]
MSKNLNVINKRVDDIPLLCAFFKQMGVQSLLDQHFPTHGNWQGLSLGWVAVVWLSYILSQADHRLSHVQPWAEKRLETLRGCTTDTLRALDLTDDRLQAVLRYLSDDGAWSAFERELGSHLVQVYDLKPRTARLDSTSASTYCGINPDGLFQYGHSKDHRPDLAQVKLMLSTLDPLGMPIATEVLPGNKADDPLYIPAIERVRSTLNQSGLLYIGDCKMAALSTRGVVVANQDYYLCPLSVTQLAALELENYLSPVSSGQQALTSIDYDYADGSTKQIAVGYETPVTRSTTVNGQVVSWTERLLFVRSTAVAASGEKALLSRLEKAQLALAQLHQPKRGKKRLTNLLSWQEAASAIVQSYHVQGLLQLDYQVSHTKRLVRGYRQRNPRIVSESQIRLVVRVNDPALNRQINLLGWRVYVTNQPAQQLSLADAVIAYRQEYLIERGFGRFKGFPLSLSPMYLQREDHVIGLMRLLSIGLRILTLLEFSVRRNLAAQKQKLAGLYAANPKRATANPTAEQLLAAFDDITLLLIDAPDRTYVHLTPLSPLQQRILSLLCLTLEIYTQLSIDDAVP